jgi:hypothetical protein
VLFSDVFWGDKDTLKPNLLRTKCLWWGSQENLDLRMLYVTLYAISLALRTRLLSMLTTLPCAPSRTMEDTHCAKRARNGLGQVLEEAPQRVVCRQAVGYVNALLEKV